MNRCLWSEDTDGLWATSCGEVHEEFMCDGPKENHYRYCPYCGEPIEVEVWEGEDE